MEATVSDFLVRWFPKVYPDSVGTLRVVFRGCEEQAILLARRLAEDATIREVTMERVE